MTHASATAAEIRRALLLREEIALLWAQPEVSKREIARRIGRSHSTVVRELERNAGVRRPKLAPRADGKARPPGPVPGTRRGRDRPSFRPGLPSGRRARSG